MKKNAFAKLIKDVILAVAFWGLAVMLLKGFNMDNAAATSMGMMFAGVPFGWRWSSKFITAISMRGIGEKLLISFLVGTIAVFVVLGWDVVRCIGQLIGNAGAKKRERRYVETY